jgi:hypothetical protein
MKSMPESKRKVMLLYWVAMAVTVEALFFNFVFDHTHNYNTFTHTALLSIFAFGIHFTLFNYYKGLIPCYKLFIAFLLLCIIWDLFIFIKIITLSSEINSLEPIKILLSTTFVYAAVLSVIATMIRFRLLSSNRNLTNT